MEIISNVNMLLPPDPPSRHHLPFDKLTALRKAEGLRCLRSLLGAPAGSGIFDLHLMPWYRPTALAWRKNAASVVEAMTFFERGYLTKNYTEFWCG